ncbi:hypothetical protein [Pseudomonas orientalis]|uniref:hypothetical protein n=1 Tax=Pseudomonas orientalis TaxID=76758 RepID=UPI0013000F54
MSGYTRRAQVFREQARSYRVFAMWGDLSEVCAVPVSGVVIQALEICSGIEKTVVQPDWQPEE